MNDTTGSTASDGCVQEKERVVEGVNPGWVSPEGERKFAATNGLKEGRSGDSRPGKSLFHGGKQGLAYNYHNYKPF